MGSKNKPFVGDNCYASPEFMEAFFSNSQTDYFKADVFSFGITLVELILKEKITQNGVIWDMLQEGNSQKVF